MGQVVQFGDMAFKTITPLDLLRLSEFSMRYGADHSTERGKVERTIRGILPVMSPADVVTLASIANTIGWVKFSDELTRYHDEQMRRKVRE